MFCYGRRRSFSHSDSDSEELNAPEIDNIEEPQFTIETFMNVAKFLLKRDNNED